MISRHRSPSASDPEDSAAANALLMSTQSSIESERTGVSGRNLPNASWRRRSDSDIGPMEPSDLSGYCVPMKMDHPEDGSWEPLLDEDAMSPDSESEHAVRPRPTWAMMRTATKVDEQGFI